jgi:hypothetical protein
VGRETPPLTHDAPAAVVMRMLILQHLFDRTYDDLEREDIAASGNR